jgi:hypothetical protein
MLLWDYIFLEGWSGIFRVVFSILKILEPTILDVDLEGVSVLIWTVDRAHSVCFIAAGNINAKLEEDCQFD